MRTILAIGGFAEAEPSIRRDRPIVGLARPGLAVTHLFDPTRPATALSGDASGSEPRQPALWPTTHAGTRALLEASRQASATPASNRDARPAATFEQIHSRLGWVGINRLTADQLAATVGLEAAPDDATVLKYFGSGADPRDMNQLHRSDPRRYRQIKEYGRLRRLL